MTSSGSTSPDANTMRTAASPGVSLAAFGDGALAYDVCTQTAHVLGPVAAWILDRSFDGPVPIADLAADATRESGLDGAHQQVATAIGELRTLGLLDRETPYVPVEPMPGSPHRADRRSLGGVHAVLGHGIVFRSDDIYLLHEVDRFLGTVLDDRDPTVAIDLFPQADGSVVLQAADEWRFPTRSALFAQLPGVVNEYAARSHGHIVFHAGAVRTPDGRVVLVPGRVDAGKSTVVGALLEAGCDYLGDESIGIRPGTLDAMAYPKPITLDANSRVVLGLPPSPDPHLSVDEIRTGTARLAGDVGPVSHVLLAEYLGPVPSDPHRVPPSVTAERLEPVTAVKALLANTLNLGRAGQHGLESLCLLAGSVPVTRVIHPDSRALARAVVDGELLAG